MPDKLQGPEVARLWLTANSVFGGEGLKTLEEDHNRARVAEIYLDLLNQEILLKITNKAESWEEKFKSIMDQFYDLPLSQKRKIYWAIESIIADEFK